MELSYVKGRTLMESYTQSFSEFSFRIREVRQLRIHANDFSNDESEYGIGLQNSACRGAIVLLCGHIEAYFISLGKLILTTIQNESVPAKKLPIPFLFHMSQNRIYSIEKNVAKVQGKIDYRKIHNAIQEFLLHDSKVWRKEGSILEVANIDNFTDKKSVQKFGDLVNYFDRFGYRNFSDEFNSKFKHNSSALKDAYNNIIGKRNAIAHGDEKINAVPNEIQLMEGTAEEVCGAVDQLFSNWCHKTFDVTIRLSKDPITP